MDKEKIGASDFGLFENESPHKTFKFSDYVDDYTRTYGSIIRYSIDRDYQDIYSLSGEVITRIPSFTTYDIQYYCPSCGATYAFKGRLQPKETNTFRQTTCLSCGNTISLGI